MRTGNYNVCGFFEDVLCSVTDTNISSNSTLNISHAFVPGEFVIKFHSKEKS